MTKKMRSYRLDQETINKINALQKKHKEGGLFLSQADILQKAVFLYHMKEIKYQ